MLVVSVSRPSPWPASKSSPRPVSRSWARLVSLAGGGEAGDRGRSVAVGPTIGLLGVGPVLLVWFVILGRVMPTLQYSRRTGGPRRRRQ